jgi:hypothetical protein
MLPVEFIEHLSILLQATFLCKHRVGASRSIVIQNQDVVKELKMGMLVAVATADSFVKVGVLYLRHQHEPRKELLIGLNFSDTSERAPRRNQYL